MFGKKGSAGLGEIETVSVANAASQNSKPVNRSNSVFEAGGESRTIDYGTQPILHYTDPKLETLSYKNAKSQVFEVLIEKFNFNAIRELPEDLQNERIYQASIKIVNDLGLPLNSAQIDLLKKQIIDDTKGFGPLEKLLSDPEVSDIMINSHRSVYIEKNGKIYPTDLTFSNEPHLMNVIQKIVSIVGRRVDESSPMVDARMPDGSRFNAIVPPLALDGALVSIRKFKRDKLRLENYVDLGSISEQMYHFLSICGASRLNILISGGTGSGKTTLLNALSAFINPSERIVTIEDAAELQLKQPHILRLESRPPNMEGAGAISPRQLLRNALRMRPDRIILGEIRGDEVVDVLQAMNTGHEGSMATIHANNPRDCLSRVENLFGLSGLTMPISALRQQVSNALHVIVQISRMRDGVRRVTSITEVLGMENGEIKYQEIFAFKPGAMGDDGRLHGEFICHKVLPVFAEQVQYYGYLPQMKQALGLTEK